jgi:hypothetical protein
VAEVEPPAGRIPDAPGAEDYLILDDEDRIVRVGPALFETMAPFVGHELWERIPHAKELYKPHFDEARGTRRPVEFTSYYAAELKLIRAIPSGSELTVRIERIQQLDVTTLKTLEESLRAMTCSLADRVSAQPGPRAHESLRVLP